MTVIITDPEKITFEDLKADVERFLSLVKQGNIVNSTLELKVDTEWFTKNKEAEQATQKSRLEEHPLLAKYEELYIHILALPNIQNEVILASMTKTIESLVTSGLEDKTILEEDVEQIASDIQAILEKHPLVSEFKEIQHGS